MERLKHMKESIMACVEGEVCNLQQADAKELGEAIDMIKDLEEAIYYATITKAMNEKEKSEEKHETMYYPMYYPAPMYYPEGGSTSSSSNTGSNSNTGGRAYFPEKGETGHYMIYFDPYRDMDREYGKMYYSGNGRDSSSYPNGGRDNGERENPRATSMRDVREGRSPMSRKTYMEAKELHHGKEAQMKELDNYMQELTSDITEMIKDSSPEEKQLMQKKIATLAEKVGKINV